MEDVTENIAFNVEESEHLIHLLEEAKIAASKLFDIDWTKIKIQIGFQAIDKLPPQLGLKGELAEYEQDAMSFNACTLRNVLEDGALYSIIVVAEVMEHAELPHYILHELCHIITQHLAYEDKQHDTMLCSSTEELAIDLLAYAISLVHENATNFKGMHYD